MWRGGGWELGRCRWSGGAGRRRGRWGGRGALRLRARGWGCGARRCRSCLREGLHQDPGCFRLFRRPSHVLASTPTQSKGSFAMKRTSSLLHCAFETRLFWVVLPRQCCGEGKTVSKRCEKFTPRTSRERRGFSGRNLQGCQWGTAPLRSPRVSAREAPSVLEILSRPPRSLWEAVRRGGGRGRGGGPELASGPHFQQFCSVSTDAGVLRCLALRGSQTRPVRAIPERLRNGAFFISCVVCLLADAQRALSTDPGYCS